MSYTVPLVNFFGETFNIPHYQRGYRWEEQEVTELLDDLWNFAKDRDSGDFYCLQPIVLQQNNLQGYDVLDGQQRLTTLYLLLVFLEDKRLEDGYNQPLFTINYKTRKECEAFLRDKIFVSQTDRTNIDFYHICNAYKSMGLWFEKHPGAKAKLVPILMDDSSKGNRNVRFIKYEVAKGINPIEVFIRLNVGKIPLTDAELTKALLLQSDKYEKEEFQFIKMWLFEIATEWDGIEYTMQNDEFWYFLSNQTNDKPTHIEFIFDLVANRINKEKKYFETKPLKHSTFLILSAYLTDLIDKENFERIDAVKRVWEQVNEYFEYFKDWFNNRKLYHYIGFLIAFPPKGSSLIDTLIGKSKELSKTRFEEYLRKQISSLILIEKERTDSYGKKYSVQLENLNYENEDQQTNDIAEINRILLLHNVYTTFKSEKEKARFPFNLFKQTKRNEKWSLEHIHAQNSENITKRENQNTWLDDHIKSLSRQNNPDFESLLQTMNSLRNSTKIEKEEFQVLVDEVYQVINKISGNSEYRSHSISNLCLVDAITNSRLNNSVFDVKREIIKQRELEGFYIPICTRNVFLKAYTEYPINNAYWTESDKQAYVQSIKNTYEYFINTNHKN